MELGQKVMISGHLRQAFHGFDLDKHNDDHDGSEEPLLIDRFRIEEKEESGVVCGKRSMHMKKSVEYYESSYQAGFEIRGDYYQDIYLVAVNMNTIRKATLDLIKNT